METRDAATILIGCAMMFYIVTHFVDKREQREFELKKLNCTTDVEGK